MKKIAKLIYQELAANFSVAYAVFFTVVFIIDFFDKIDDTIGAKLGVYQTASYFLFKMPFYHSQIIVFVLVISAMTTLNIMSQKNEIVAILASGINIRRIFFAILGFIAAVNIASFISTCFISPHFLARADALLKKNQTSSAKLTDITIKSNNNFIFIDAILPQERTLLNVYIATVDETTRKLGHVYYAPVARYENSNWTFTNGRHISVTEGDAAKSDNGLLPDINVLHGVSAISYRPEWLSAGDLWKIIRSGMTWGMEIKSYVYLLAQKTVRFLSVFGIFFVVFPLGFQLGRNKKNAEIIFIGVIILLLFTVYDIFMFKIAQGAGINALIPAILILLPLAPLGFFIRKRHFFWRS